MQKQKLILIIGIVLGIIAVILIKVYLDQQRRYIEEREKLKAEKMQENLVPTLVAKGNIPKGSKIESEMLEVQMSPKESLQPQAVNTLSRIAGMTTVIPISKGEQITLNKLIWPRDETNNASVGGTLAMVTPVGKRAITISVDNIASLAGMIKAGDYVDVIALIPVPTETEDKKQTVQVAVTPLFQNVPVLAVGRDITRPLSPQSPLPEVSRYSKPTEDKVDRSNPQALITLALAPQEANIIAFVTEQGKIRLTLRSPADSQVQPAVPTTWDALFRYILPAKEISQKKSDKGSEEKIDYVEIYRGLNKERVPLSR